MSGQAELLLGGVCATLYLVSLLLCSRVSAMSGQAEPLLGGCVCYLVSGITDAV